MIFQKIFFAVSLTVFLTGQLWAQQDSLSKKWTVAECIDYAVQHNITVKKAELTKQSAEVTLNQSKLNRLPNLNGSASQSLTSGRSIDPITSDFVNQQIHSTSLGISTSVTLYNGNQQVNKVKQNQLLIEQNDFLVEQAKNNIRISIAQTYLQALYALESIRVAENNLKATEEQERQSKGLYEAHSVALKDYLDAQSQTATNRYNLINAQTNYQQQLLTLRQLLELQPGEPFEIAEVDPQTAEKLLIPDKMDVYNRALGYLPELNSAQKNLEVLDKSLDIAKAGYIPTLSLSGSLGTGYTSTQNYNFADQLNLNFNQRVGLSLSIPIYDRGQTKNNKQTAQIQIDQAQYDLQTAQKTVYKNVETAWLNATAYQQQLESSKAAMDAAQSAYELATKKFELGALTGTDLIVSQNTYVNAQQNYLQAKYMAIMYVQLLNLYQGTPIQF